jgi:hypothetical protein
VYLNAKRIDELYAQGVSRIDNVISTNELGPEFSAGLLKIFGFKLSGKMASSSEVIISSADKALLVELAARQGRDLREIRPEDESLPNGALVYYVGKSRLINDNQEANPETMGMPAEVAWTVHQRRIAQAKGSKQGTIVWTSAVGGTNLAAIAYLESVVDVGHIYSYPVGTYGILGHKESEEKNLLFIAPVWIWYDVQTLRPIP